ncbi:MAG TPA: hypothetical protein VEL75_22045 [Candidatus Methylomirabilis sp.]|nr:hypothetical protein [Candidatus Methylomirabilis sp.]
MASDDHHDDDVVAMVTDATGVSNSQAIQPSSRGQLGWRWLL